MVEQKTLDTISGLFLDIESSFGTRNFSFLTWESFMYAMKNFRGTPDEFIYQIRNVVYVSKNTSPRISLLIFMFCKFLEFFMNDKTENDDIKTLQNLAFKIAKQILDERKSSAKKLIRSAKDIIQNKDVILIHTCSHTVFDILENANKNNKKFRVILAEQDPKRTSQVIRFLQKHDIPFQVIPEYLLSHLEGDITKFLTGAVTINSHYNVISDAGSTALVSELRHHNIPVYVCITTDKLSLWDAKGKHHHYKSKSQKNHYGIEYEKLIFSHDRYSIDMVDYFVTNKGILSKEQIKKLYKERFLKQRKWRVKHGI